MILVTGASRGLGRAISERLVANGEKVIGLARNIDSLNTDGIRCDVSDYLSVKQASRDVKKLKEPIKAFIKSLFLSYHTK